MRPSAERRAEVTRPSIQGASTSEKRREIWRQLEPLRALLDSPTSTTKRFKLWRVDSTMQCGVGPTILPKRRGIAAEWRPGRLRCGGQWRGRHGRRGRDMRWQQVWARVGFWEGLGEPALRRDGRQNPPRDSGS